jgi:replication-associated recombination protein RarA
MVYDAINEALSVVASGTPIAVPLHLRNYPPQDNRNSYSGYLPESLQELRLLRDKT